jgi:hypothetical protein
MRALTPQGEKIIKAIAERHAVSVDAVQVMLDAVMRGGGTMAQFNHPELGGGGQWLRGGMTMVGDMFNNALKAKVDALCSELSALVFNAQQADVMFARASPPQSQAQSQHSSHRGTHRPGFASFSASSGNWWPAELGNPAATGAQNDMRYAYFPEKRRVALERGGRVEVLDTGEHFISGFGQQQGGGDSITFTSQHGPVSLASLRRVDGGHDNTAGERGRGDDARAEAAVIRSSEPPHDPAAILGLIERLAELKDKGALTEQEFAAKKAELLKRL